MPIVWEIEGHTERSNMRFITVRRVVNGNVDGAERFSGAFHQGETKLDVKAEFKKQYLARKADKLAKRTFIADSDLATFETEVNA